MSIETIVIILGIILGIYEVLSRAIPSIENNSILGFIVKFLKWLSDVLNNQNPQAKQIEKDANQMIKVELKKLKLNNKVKKNAY